MTAITADTRQQLIDAALQARSWAYAPYSRYLVGAAILTESGRIYDGGNIENAVFPLTICAERVAVFKAVSEGERQFQAIAVVNVNAGMPCGSCRQVLAEYSLDTQVIIANTSGVVAWEGSVSDLLPGAFTPGDLQRE